MSAEQASTHRPKFWELPLSSLNDSEWEALCDGCGRCCLKKFSDEDDEDSIAWTRVVCRYFDEDTSSCSCYADRTKRVPDCVDVRTLDLLNTQWVPDTCAYKLRARGKSLYPWHPLIAESKNELQEAEISIAGRIISEEHVHPEGYYEHVIRWVEST